MAARHCVTCHALVPNGSTCSTCERARDRARARVRGTTAQRGYDAAHKRMRRELLARFEREHVALCVRCCRTMTFGQDDVDLGHDDNDRSIIRGLEHRACNRATNERGRRTAHGESRPWRVA
jgi:hypothetical protein